MKKSVKTLALITILSLSLPGLTTAQLISVADNSIGADIRKVIEDYPNHFANLLGEVIIQNPQSTDYGCKLKINGAEECTITQYTSKDNSMFSWQALMLTTDDFAAAKKKYHALFMQLNNLDFKFGSQLYHLKGSYDQPSEEKRFASAILSPGPADESVKKLKVEVSLEYEVMQWKVKILIYEREREDNERGNTTDQ